MLLIEAALRTRRVRIGEFFRLDFNQWRMVQVRGWWSLPTPVCSPTANSTMRYGAPPAQGVSRDQPIKPAQPLHIDEPESTG
jgi:hypothetical protein